MTWRHYQHQADKIRTLTVPHYIYLFQYFLSQDREAEGDEFEDKEKFVTSAYKKKMAELQALEEEEKRKEALEGKASLFFM